MIRLRGQLRCMNDTERAAVLAHMADHIRLTRAEPACLSFDIAETDDPLTFDVMEAMALGSSAKKFHAVQQASRISS